MMRPGFVSNRDLAFSAQSRVDFNSVLAPDPADISGTIGIAYFDSALWDTGQWSGASNTYQRWTNAGNVGFAGTIALSITGNSDVLWTSTDWVYEAGGVL